MLHLSVTDMLHSQSALFPFMQFMKSEGALNILQFCLTVGKSVKQLTHNYKQPVSELSTNIYFV